MRLYEVDLKIYITKEEVLWDNDIFVVEGDDEYSAINQAFSLAHNSHRIRGEKLRGIRWTNNHTVAYPDYDYRVCINPEKLYKFVFRATEIIELEG